MSQVMRGLHWKRCLVYIDDILVFGSDFESALHSLELVLIRVAEFTKCNLFRFDFIECFTTTFLRAHSWLNWVDEDDDEDEVGLKEKPEDTRYIKKITSK